MSDNAQPSGLSTSTIQPLLSYSLASPRIIAWLNSLLPSSSPPSPTPQPTIKSYPEAQYHTYLPLGLDLIYSPPTTTSAEWQLDRIDIYNPIPGIALPVAGSSRRRAPPVYRPPKLPIVVQLARAPVNLPPPPPPPPSTGLPVDPNQTTIHAAASESAQETSERGRPEPLLITAETTGREFVAALGEPSRKGGAQGWVGPWLEWSDLRVIVGESPQRAVGEAGEEKEVGIGLMVELRQTYREPTAEEMKNGMGGVWDQAAGWGWGCVKIFRVGSTI